MERPTSRAVKWLLLSLIVAWAAVIFYLSSLGHASLSSDVAVDWITRKLAHVLVFAALAFMVCDLSSRLDVAIGLGALRSMVIGFVAAALYGVSDEIHQSFVVGRSPLVTDVLIDAGGALLGVLAWRWLRSRRASRA